MDLMASNRHWRLALTGRIETGWIPIVVAISGFIISLLLAALFYALARTGHHARALANRMTQELSANRELLTSVSNNVRDGIYRGTPESGIVYINRTLARMFGYNDEFAIGADVLSMRYADSSRHDELREKLFRENHYEDEEVEFVRDDKSRFTGLNSAWATCNDEGRILYYDGVVTDITERKAAARRIEQMTYYDHLTGLPNQTFLEERFEVIADSSENSGVQMAVLLIDLDNFKDINALHGHEIGDQLLQKVAQRLRAHLRSDDIAARMGGNEFIILLRMAISVAVVTQTANRIRETLSVPYEIDEQELHTTPSIGIAMYPQDGSDLSSLRQHADNALYQAKRSGRASIAYFAQHLNEQARRQVQIENAMRPAIERGEMSVYYQPRANVSDGSLDGVESLLRWHHPEWGEIEPTEFIPIAERTGQIVSLGDWVLEQALKEWKIWAEKIDRPPRVGVNVSARQLQDDSHFDKTVALMLRKYDIAGEALEIEITETMLVDHIQKRAVTLSNIKALGVNIALDDFGTGYSSLSYLSRFVVDVIKVDQSFIQGLSVDTKDTAIVHTVSILSRAMGIELVAEGVETEVQLNALRRMRYHAVQGYLFAPPMPGKALLDFMLRLQKEGPPAVFTSA
jgi:diguanylate cyclase (GGDEF)-like protein/PAS domain S-box-containing protein